MHRLKLELPSNGILHRMERLAEFLRYIFFTRRSVFFAASEREQVVTASSDIELIEPALLVRPVPALAQRGRNPVLTRCSA